MKGLIATIAITVAIGCAGTDAQVDRILREARVELRHGQVATAQQMVDRGAALTQSAPDSLAAWKIRLLRSEVQIARLEMAEALKTLEATVPEGTAFDHLRGQQKYQLALIQLARGQLKPALSSLEAASVSAAGDPDLLLDIEVLDSQARLRLGQWNDAEQRLDAAFRTARDRKDRFREALAVNYLGMSRLIRNRYDDALPQFERVLSYSDLDQTRIYAASLTNAGICLARLGQYDKALALQQRAVETYERSGRKQELMRALGEVGTTHLLRGDLAEALPHLQRAHAIAKEAGLAADGALWARNLAAAHVLLGNWDSAEQYDTEARRLNPPNQPQIAQTAIQAQVAAGRGQHREAARLFQEVLTNPATLPSTQWVAHEGLARLAIADGKSSDAAAHFESALTTIEQSRSALLKTDYRLSLLTRLIYFHDTYVDFLIREGRIDRALEVADSSRGRVLAERLGGVAAPKRGAATMFRQQARENNQVSVFYWLSSARSMAWVVSSQGIRSFPLAGRAEIEPLIDQYHAQILNTGVDPLATSEGPGDKLYARLVAPLAAALPHNASLVIVPDGALHRLNFETLPVRAGSKPHYWIEDVTIQIAPSLSMMATATKPAAAARPLLLVGNPTPRAPEYPALTYAAAEMEGVSKPFGNGNVTVLQSEGASPAGFRGANPEQFSRIHFTSHAVANPESPMDSAVILSGPDTGFKLYARDVAEMSLTADLVTVSACRSAGDRAVKGEGLVGFAWAFLRAGSRRVVAGLWDVDDRSTAALMPDFYAKLAAGEPAPSALRNAKLALLHERAMKPYYWAPLQMFTASP
jgi:CHAT domain-containing protein